MRKLRLLVAAALLVSAGPAVATDLMVVVTNHKGQTVGGAEVKIQSQVAVNADWEFTDGQGVALMVANLAKDPWIVEVKKAGYKPKYLSGVEFADYWDPSTGWCYFDVQLEPVMGPGPG